jgi:hypothetical protein
MTTDLKVSEFDYDANSDGNLRVTATVQNESDELATVTLIANVKAGKGTKRQELDQSARLEVDSGQSADTSFTFDVPYTRFERNGSLDLELHSERT